MARVRPHAFFAALNFMIAGLLAGNFGLKYGVFNASLSVYYALLALTENVGTVANG